MASNPISDSPRGRVEDYYLRYARTVRGLCGALLRDRTEAEDAAQQVFLSAYRALLNGSEPREPAAWLATIARNECRVRMRARGRALLSIADVDSAAGLPNPVAEAIRRADLAALWNAIRELPPQQREALVLREFGGLSYEELAVALSVTTPAVESLLFRARRQLRTRLGSVSWLDELVRLFVGSAPAVATKTVALGLGAAAVTGTAVVTPRILERPTPHAHLPRTANVVANEPKRVTTATAVATSTPTPTPIVQHVVYTVPKVEHEVEREHLTTTVRSYFAVVARRDDGGTRARHADANETEPSDDR